MVLKQLEDAMFLKKFQQRETYLNEMQGLLDTCKTEQRALTNKEETTFSTLEKKVEDLSKELDNDTFEDVTERIEERAKRVEAMRNDNKNKKNNNQTENEIRQTEIRQFVEFVRTGNTRDLGSANSGQALIPLTIAKKIVDRVFEISPLIKEATIYEVSEDLNLPVYDYSSHVTAFLTEFEEIVTSQGTFAYVPLKSHIIGTMTKIGKSLLNRSDLDVLPFIIDACAKSVAKFLENEIILNTNNRFASTLANGVAQMVKTATPMEITPEEIVKMKNSIPSSMLPNAKWLMHKDTLTYLQSLTDANGNFIFGNTLAENNGNVLLGYEVMLSDAMLGIGIGARQIYFGDFQEGLAIKLGAQSAEVYRELFASQYAVGVGHFIEADVSAVHSVQAITVMIGAS